jgi:NAD-dependent dihydropyrimidine dehydrogenase PreA subunit
MRSLGGLVNRAEIKSDECKGCCLCIEACPKGCLQLGTSINAIGYQYVQFQEGACSACGMCYYVCPEPGAIAVYGEKKKVGEKTKE